MTDQQHKFYIRIGLLSTATDITEMEKLNLQRAKKWLDRGDELKFVINPLCLGLEDLESERLQGRLSPPVKKLFDELVEVYGRPRKPEFVSGFGFVGPI